MILEILILLLSIPTGFLLAWLARDELVPGRRWFVIIIIISLIAGIWFFLVKNKILVFTLIFIFITVLISYIKSFDKTWAKVAKS